VEGRCDADRHEVRRETAQYNSFRDSMPVLQNGGGWSVGERGVTTVAGDVASARAEGLSNAACLDETEFLLLSFAFFDFLYELAVHDAVDIGFA